MCDSYLEPFSYGETLEKRFFFPLDGIQIWICTHDTVLFCADFLFFILNVQCQ